MPLAVGGPRPQSPQEHTLPVSWDVTLASSQVQFVDLDRRAARADVTLTVPLSQLGLTKQQAKRLLEGDPAFQWIAPGADGVRPEVSLKGNNLVVNARGVDGRGFFAVAPRLAFTDSRGVARTMTFRTPAATLREKDPEIRAGWGGSGLQERRDAQKAAWQSYRADHQAKRQAVKDEFEGPERRELLGQLRQSKREARATHREQLQQTREDTRDQRRDRRQAERRDRRGQVTVETNQR